jgi:hypothetical protein
LEWSITQAQEMSKSFFFFMFRNIKKSLGTSLFKKRRNANKNEEYESISPCINLFSISFVAHTNLNTKVQSQIV